MTIIWYQEAQETLQYIYNYHKRISEKVAEKLYKDIMNEADRLAIFPFMAPAEPLLSYKIENYRSLVVREHYKLIYFVDEQEETVSIVRVWDCRQNPAKLRTGHLNEPSFNYTQSL